MQTPYLHGSLAEDNRQQEKESGIRDLTNQPFQSLIVGVDLTIIGERLLR